MRVLLAHSQSRRWSTTELAEAAEVHVSTASRVIRELRRRRLVEDESPGQGRRSMIWVPDGDALLQAWTRSYTWEDNPPLRVAAPIGSTSRFIERMATLFTRERWALTLHAGASLVAPHAMFDAIHVYLEGDRPGESLVLDHGWETVLHDGTEPRESQLHSLRFLGRQVVSALGLTGNQSRLRRPHLLVRTHPVGQL